MACGWVALLAAHSQHRVATVWTSDLSLWADAMTTASSRPRVLINYGSALDHAGYAHLAVGAYQQALMELLGRHDAHRVAYQQLAAANMALSPARVPPEVTREGLRLAGCTTPERHEEGPYRLWTCHGKRTY